MDIEQRILFNMITEAQQMMVFNDLTHLPRVLFLLEKYAYLNDIKLNFNSKDLKELTKLSYLR